MERDYRTGVIWGSVLVAIAVLWLATRPGLSTKASLAGPLHQQVRDVEPAPGSLGSPRSPSVDEPTAEIPENNQSPITNLQSQAPDLTVYEQAEKIKTDRFHFVQEGETLSEISQQYYGSARKWQNIFDANRKVVKNPRNLKSGTKLIIPD